MSRNLRTGLGVLLSLLLLGWALRGVSFQEVVFRIRNADPWLFSLSIVVALLGFHVRALRWGFLLAPIDRAIAFRPRLAATFIGFAVNNLLPARVGEFARAFTLAKLTNLRAATAFATLVVERLLDGLVLVALLFATMALPGFPTIQLAGIDIRNAALIFALVAATIGVALFLAVLNRKRAGNAVHVLSRALPERLRGPLREILRSFATGLEVLVSPRLFVISVVFAVGQWIFLATSYVLAFRAFDILSVPFSGAIFLQSLISLAVAPPSTPGFFGPFEAATKAGLGLWAIPEGQAVSFAIGYHLAGFLPVTLIGVYYIWKLNLSWSDVRQGEQSLAVPLHSVNPAVTVEPSEQ